MREDQEEYRAVLVRVWERIFDPSALLPELGESFRERARAQAAAAGVIADALCREAERRFSVCAWREDESDGSWNGDCGVKWSLEGGGPEHHAMSFCPGCGRCLQEVRP